MTNSLAVPHNKPLQPAAAVAPRRIELRSWARRLSATVRPHGKRQMTVGFQRGKKVRLVP
jgi:hypothetical protein